MIRRPRLDDRAEREFEWVGDAADGEDAIRLAPGWHRTSCSSTS
ncbi:MAG: hypothetical protein U1F25_17370 [Rubrivivax sp.]